VIGYFLKNLCFYIALVYYPTSREGGFMQSQNPSMFDVQSVDLSLGKDILR